MQYPRQSIPRGLLEGETDAVEVVIRWISATLTWPRFWSLRGQWPDLVQETLTRLIESLRDGRFDPSRDFRFYVQGIARHTAIQALHVEARRRRQIGAGNTADAAVENGPSAPDALVQQQLVRRVMDLASEECRLLIRLYFLEEKGYQEISEELMLPLGTVKSRLFRCIEGAQRVLRTARRPPEAS